jgi:hypothetical protein
MSRIGISGHRGLPDWTQKLVDAALCAVLVPHAGPDLVGISRPTGQEVNQRWQSANLGSPGACEPVAGGVLARSLTSGVRHQASP